MLGHMALHENSCYFRVETNCEKCGGKFESARAQDARTIGHCERMKVDDAMEGVAFVLAHDPIAQSPKIIAQMDDSGGLDTGQDARHGSRITALYRLLGLIRSC